MQYLFGIMTVLFILVSIGLVLIILVQRPQGGGLSGAFGGGGGTDTAFGGRTGDALTVATITAFAIYLLLAIGLNITSHVSLEPAAAPAAATTPTDGTQPATPAADGGAAPTGETPAPAAETPATAPAAETPAPAPATTPAPAPTPGG